jgi:hypothetical protein
MKVWYDKNAKVRIFQPGDKVLVFLPVPGQPLQAKYCGPFENAVHVSNCLELPYKHNIIFL